MTGCAKTIIAEARQQGRTALDEAAGKELLAQLRHRGAEDRVVVPGCATRSTSVLRGAQAAARRSRSMSPDILHKSDVGGVRVGLTQRRGDSARRSGAMMARAADRQRARATASSSRRWRRRDRRSSSAACAIRSSGRSSWWASAACSSRCWPTWLSASVPITRLDAEEMLDELKGAALLKGARGRKPASRAAIVDVLLKIGGEDGLLMRHARGHAGGGHQSAHRVGERRRWRSMPVRPDASDGVTPAARARSESDWKRRRPRASSRRSSSRRPSRSSARRRKGTTLPQHLHPAHPRVRLRRARSIRSIPSADDDRRAAGLPQPRRHAGAGRLRVHRDSGRARYRRCSRAARGRVRYAQVISSGFGEVDEGKALQDELAAAARAGGMRLIGPNCLGMYSPRGGIVFSETWPEDGRPRRRRSRRAAASAPTSSGAASPAASGSRAS